MYLHGLVGGVQLVAAQLVFVELLRNPSPGGVRFAVPTVVGAGGMIVLLYVCAHHLNHVRADGEDIDLAHWVIGAALTSAGIITGIGRARIQHGQLHELALPVSNIVVGTLFLVHGNGGFGDLVLHLSIAATLVLSALAHIAVILAEEEARSLRLFSSMLLAVGAVRLCFYEADQSPAATAADHRHFED